VFVTAEDFDKWVDPIPEPRWSFVDGNKRAGYTLMRLTLRTFDLDIKATDDDEYDIVIQVATGKLDAEGIRAWLESRVVPMKHK
jgi:prophage maintenance system killer protein